MRARKKQIPVMRKACLWQGGQTRMGMARASRIMASKTSGAPSGGEKSPGGKSAVTNARQGLLQDPWDALGGQRRAGVSSAPPASASRTMVSGQARRLPYVKLSGSMSTASVTTSGRVSDRMSATYRQTGLPPGTQNRSGDWDSEPRPATACNISQFIVGFREGAASY
jgi:hypothetical protein